MITALLRVIVDGAALPSPLGLGLVAAGSIIVIVAGLIQPVRRRIAEPA